MLVLGVEQIKVRGTVPFYTELIWLVNQAQSTSNSGCLLSATSSRSNVGYTEVGLFLSYSHSEPTMPISPTYPAWCYAGSDRTLSQRLTSTHQPDPTATNTFPDAWALDLTCNFLLTSIHQLNNKSKNVASLLMLWLPPVNQTRRLQTRPQPGRRNSQFRQ